MGPVSYGGAHALVGDGIGFPTSINFFAPSTNYTHAACLNLAVERLTLQADQDHAALIPVYLMSGQAGDLIGDVDRHLLLNYHQLKYELKVIAFDGDITGRFYVLFKMVREWSEKLPDGTQACLHNCIHRPLKEMTVEGIYLGKRWSANYSFDI
ncbi:unnamed protein product [Prunus armeniaca]